MTTRDKFRKEIIRSQSLLKRGAAMTLGGFALMVFTPLFTEDSSRYTCLPALLAVITGIGFFTWVYSILRLRGVIKCPSCGKRLSYLLTDPSYSKTAAQFGIPGDLPNNITDCPYCHEDLGQ